MSLCLSCGVCCDGTMFRVVRLAEGEAAPLEGRVTFSDDRVHLVQPCRALGKDCKCAVYEVRPGICRRYRCLALAGLESGKLSALEAQELVDEVITRRRELADAMGLDDVHAAVAQARADESVLSETVESRLSRLRRALLILQLQPDDPILTSR